MKIDYKQMQKVIDCVRDFGVKGTKDEKAIAFDYLVNYFNNTMKRHDARSVWFKSLSESAVNKNLKNGFMHRSEIEALECDEADKALNFMVELLGLLHAGYRPTHNRRAVEDLKSELSRMSMHERCKYYGVVRFEESAFLPCALDCNKIDCKHCKEC